MEIVFGLGGGGGKECLGWEGEGGEGEPLLHAAHLA
jgi:hypothetical protein